MAVTKLSLYNKTLILLGQRVLSSDTEDRPSRHKLDALYDNGAVDYCLEIIQPKFASKTESLAGGTPTLTTGYSEEVDLPTSFLTLVDPDKLGRGVYADASLDQPVTRFTHEADKILSDVDPIYIRYVQDFDTIGLTNMTRSFAEVVSAYMARELSVNIDPDETENLNAELEKRIEVSTKRDADTESDQKGLSGLTLNTAWYNIYNDALQILGQPRLASITDDSLRKNQLDIARNSEVVEAALEDEAWHFAIESAKLNYDPGIEPEYGQPHAFEKPSDLHRLDGVWVDEYHQHPIHTYTDESGYIFTDYQTIYIQYVSKDYLTDPTTWRSYFKRFVAAQMALNAGPSIPGSDMANAKEIYKERRSEGLSTDAVQSPPRHLTRGSWSESRTHRYPTSNRNRP